MMPLTPPRKKARTVFALFESPRYLIEAESGYFVDAEVGLALAVI